MGWVCYFQCVLQLMMTYLSVWFYSFNVSNDSILFIYCGKKRSKFKKKKLLYFLKKSVKDIIFNVIQVVLNDFKWFWVIYLHYISKIRITWNLENIYMKSPKHFSILTFYIFFLYIKIWTGYYKKKTKYFKKGSWKVWRSFWSWEKQKPSICLWMM